MVRRSNGFVFAIDIGPTGLEAEVKQLAVKPVDEPVSPQPRPFFFDLGRVGPIANNDFNLIRQSDFEAVRSKWTRVRLRGGVVHSFGCL